MLERPSGKNKPVLPVVVVGAARIKSCLCLNQCFVLTFSITYNFGFLFI